MGEALFSKRGEKPPVHTFRISIHIFREFVKLRIAGKNTVVTIPKDPTVTLGWKVGDYIKLETKDHQLLLSKVLISKAES